MHFQWYHEHDASTADILYNLQDLRTENPIVWALIQGLHTSRSIAARLCWPHDDVLFHLRQLKQQGTVYDTEGKRSILWYLSPDERQYRYYEAWVARQKQRGGLFNPIEEAQE